MFMDSERSIAPLVVSSGRNQKPEDVIARIPAEIKKLVDEMTPNERYETLATISQTVGALAIENLKQTAGTPDSHQARQAARAVAQTGNWVSSELAHPTN